MKKGSVALWIILAQMFAVVHYMRVGGVAGCIMDKWSLRVLDLDYRFILVLRETRKAFGKREMRQWQGIHLGKKKKKKSLTHHLLEIY